MGLEPEAGHQAHDAGSRHLEVIKALVRTVRWLVWQERSQGGYLGEIS